MEKTQANIRAKELRDVLNEASRRYYVENMPTMSDYEFDMLLKELEAIEAEYPELITPDSPTQKVGSDLGKAKTQKKEFEQHPHKYPMLSLGNTYDITEVEAFAERAAKGIGNAFTYSCELKFDGTAICLTYRDGKLFRALTRGDGAVGDDVTENVKHISNIPQVLKSDSWPQEFEIRGEIYMPWEAFDRLNEEREMEEYC
jgi:DNA ligase (NAD+)